MPGSALPRGSTRPVNGSMVTTFGGAVKTAVADGSWPGIVIEMANGPPSEAPIMSRITAFGSRRCSARFCSADSVAPVDTIRTTDERSSERPACSAASSAAFSGLANASPTNEIWVARCRSASVQSSSASNERPPEQDDRTTHDERADRQEERGAVHQRRRTQHHRAPAVGLQLRGDPTDVGDRVRDLDPGRRVRGVAERPEEVDVAPHDAFRVAGGPTRVEHQRVLAGALDARRRLGGGDDLVVPLRARQQRGAVVDLEQDPHGRHRCPRVGDPFAERPVEDEHLGTGVVADVGDLGSLVPVVHVDRRRPQLEGGVGRLEVLGTVVHQLCDPGARAAPSRRERGSQPSGPFVELPPRQRIVADDDRDLIRLRVGERLPQRRPVLAQHRRIPTLVHLRPLLLSVVGGGGADPRRRHQPQQPSATVQARILRSMFSW